jgi:hypothetical protein
MKKHALVTFVVICVIVIASTWKGTWLICLFMSILYSKIKFEIDINNDEILETV